MAGNSTRLSTLSCSDPLTFTEWPIAPCLPPLEKFKSTQIHRENAMACGLTGSLISPQVSPPSPDDTAVTLAVCASVWLHGDLIYLFFLKTHSQTDSWYESKAHQNICVYYEFKRADLSSPILGSLVAGIEQTMTEKGCKK